MATHWKLRMLKENPNIKKWKDFGFSFGEPEKEVMALNPILPTV